ncbi:phenylalanine--tRNA ligase subunit beta [Candidatus Saccharibacteria bacterium]|nr:phenylalanine--tRNA ligase subunit beta [Candidatus Saccharibacteria bacterium]
MLISLNELKKLVDIQIPDTELFQLIGSRLVEIEHVEDLAPKYKKIYVTKVLKADQIEGTHLHLCQIDAGPQLNAEVDPEHKDFIQVVCGAPNVKAGMLAAWIAPGAIVPATFDTSEPFEISARKLRGFMSFGMLAAADELALGDDHAGIISLDPKTAQPGDLLTDTLDLNDQIIEVENKSLTHRPDCFGLIGFAREVAGILGQKFTYDTTDLFKNYTSALDALKTTPNSTLSVAIADYQICPRYEAYVIDFGAPIPTEHSPKYFGADDVFFAKAGMRAISPLVDLTNRIMLMTGQPLHAFDYDKFVKISNTNAPEIRIRLARDGELLTLLDNKEIELNKNDIVICSGDTPVALAGAMGGASTAIDETTRKVIFEVASFSLYNLRKTQMSHGIFSEAITRFTKGRPASDLTLTSASIVTNSLAQFSKSRLVGSAIDTNPALIENGTFKPNVVKITTKSINDLLGSNYSDELIIKTLENTGFKITTHTDELEITAPLWRTDIHIKEDIIEEIGRLLGFDNLPLSFPMRPFTCPTIDPMPTLKSRLRAILSDRLGANEILTYSFVSKSLQEKVGEDPTDSYQIVNSISPELECFRQSLVPSLLDKIRENQKAGYSNFTLYELNQVTKKSWGLGLENVPTMQTHLGLTTFGDFYSAKHLLLELQTSLNLAFTLRPLTTSTFFEPLHSVAIFLGDDKIGELGELKASVLKRFKLDSPLAGIELALDSCISATTIKKFGITLSKFPFVSRDLTFRTAKTTSFTTIADCLVATLSRTPNFIFNLTPTSIYRQPDSPTKNLSFHLEIASPEKTLASAEVSDIIETIVKELKTLGAEVV